MSSTYNLNLGFSQLHIDYTLINFITIILVSTKISDAILELGEKCPDKDSNQRFLG